MGYPSNRRERRADMFGKYKKKNNRRRTRGRRIALAPAYSQDEIDAAQTSVERARRQRALRNIQSPY